MREMGDLCDGIGKELLSPYTAGYLDWQRLLLVRCDPREAELLVTNDTDCYCTEFQIPPQIARYGSFMFSFIGRGVFYIFFGCIQMGDNWWKYLSGALVVFVGIAYVVLEFTPSIEPPANMRDADAGWGAEQV
ncbi:unnamed protein product [Cercospora beticola]|nr:unnamed protein product [Cercospora beticola]